MSNAQNPPVWVFLTNALLAQPVVERLSTQQAADTFSVLPMSLRHWMAKKAPPLCEMSECSDPVEGWLWRHLVGAEGGLCSQYPAWAMLGEEEAPAFTRFFGSMGNMEIERDGVRFTPPEQLHIAEDEARAFWATVVPVFNQHGWCLLSNADGCHARLSCISPLPMEQASPWSVQGLRLTDCLPQGADYSDWRRLWMEIQVALHAASFNQDREARGLRPLNALWFWGGGAALMPSKGLPKIKSVSVDGVCDAVHPTAFTGEALNRFLSWASLWRLVPVSQLDLSCSTLYCVDFEGWGGDTHVFSVLEDEVLKPMRLAGMDWAWVLQGESAWRTLFGVGWLERLSVWKNKPNWMHLAEPVVEGGPSEDTLRTAWQQGQEQQDQLWAEWENRT